MRRDRERRRRYARAPRKVGDVLADLVIQRGYARSKINEQLAEAWRAASGEVLAAWSRPTGVRRGQLEVVVANSTVLQELAFRKQELLGRMQKQLPETRIGRIKFRVGQID